MATVQYPNYPRASVLVYGSNGVQALLPSTLISQADALLLAHRLEDVKDLAEQQRKKLQSVLNAERHEVYHPQPLHCQHIYFSFQLDELRYVNQRLGFQCFTETLFDDAGNRLYEGELDPRILISYYPELRGDLFSEDDTVDIMAGVAEFMPQEDSVDDLSESSSTPALASIRLCAISFPVCILPGRPSSPSPRARVAPPPLAG